ncbi:MAG: hypothetical protein J0I84_17345 [Terrimonas sp.]|nr:hypothetical protein [Terrimonas sp.]
MYLIQILPLQTALYPCFFFTIYNLGNQFPVPAPVLKAPVDDANSFDSNFNSQPCFSISFVLFALAIHISRSSLLSHLFALVQSNGIVQYSASG